MKSIHFAVAAAAALVYGSVATAGSLSAGEKSAANDLWVESAKGGYSVEYVGSGNVTGVQFDIHDKGIVEGSYSCGTQLASSHIASCTLNAEEGYLRVLVFSMTNAPLTDSTLVSISKTTGKTFSKSGSTSAVELKNVVLSDNQGQNVTPEHL